MEINQFPFHLKFFCVAWMVLLRRKGILVLRQILFVSGYFNVFVQTYVFGIGFSNDYFGLQLLRGTTRTDGILCEKGWYGFMVVFSILPQIFERYFVIIRMQWWGHSEMVRRLKLYLL